MARRRRERMSEGKKEHHRRFNRGIQHQNGGGYSRSLEGLVTKQIQKSLVTKQI